MEQKKMLTKCKVIYCIKLFLCAVICARETFGCVQGYFEDPFNSEMMIFGICLLASAFVIIMYFISTTFFLTKNFIKAKGQILANENPVTKIKGNYIPMLFIFVPIFMLASLIIPMLKVN